MSDIENSTEPLALGESTRKPRVPRVFQLLAFGILLALIFVLIKGPAESSRSARQVVITGAEVAHVKAQFERTWLRPPTRLELRQVLDKFVRDEVLYREALERGLDRYDPSVRQAMIRKITGLGVSQIEEAATDEEIQAYFSLRQERYRIPAAISFTQVYLSADRRGERLLGDAEELLKRLRQENPPEGQLPTLSDATMLRLRYSNVAEQEVDRVFGEGFYSQIAGLELRAWAGPFRSGYGYHLVRISDHTSSRIPEWMEVRSQILNDLLYEARRAAEDQFYQEIAAGYQVALESEVLELLEESEK
ncbi:MAG: peptidyl-prolyl cis-trans isomerase [Acidobacteriota bacterium]|nr:MAG: peptidyl-prolyl cis-trans isomerase [Acidobacteriota bacterium]